MRHRLALTLLALVASTAPTTVAAKSQALTTWFDRELIPAVVDHLDTHPRFRGETLLFVILDNDRPAPVTNALALSLRDRLLDAATDAEGISLAWQQQPHGDASCTRNKADYHVGIELAPDLSGRYRLAVRALDVVEGQWVAGFNQRWEGSLSTRERAAYRNTVSDPVFLGTRDVPYTSEQADLVARHLSHALSCEIFSGLNADYVVSIEPATTNGARSASGPLAGTVELATRNLDKIDAVELTARTERANARIDGKAHPIDRALHQYWLSITPLDDTLSSLSASVYVRLPGDGPAPALPEPANTSLSGKKAEITGVVMPAASRQDLLLPLSIYGPGPHGDCGPGRHDCALLHARATRDVIVYALVHADDLGLSRLGDRGCGTGPLARVITAGHSVLLPVEKPGGRSHDAFNRGRWLTEPDSTVYYAIAVDNARDARRVASLVDALPVSCAGRKSPGLDGYELQQWLESLSHLLLELGSHAGWRAIEVNPTQRGRT